MANRKLAFASMSSTTGVNTKYVDPKLCPKARYVGALLWVCECRGPCRKKPKKPKKPTRA